MTKINKNCICAFSSTKPLLALATKSKLFDPSFSLTSELILMNYKTNKQQTLTSEQKFCTLKWCDDFLVAGHENGFLSIYKLEGEKLDLSLKKQYLNNNDEIVALDYLPAKKMVAVGSSKGNILFVNVLDSDKEYHLENRSIPNLACLAWNSLITKILAVGTKDGCIKLIDIKQNSLILGIDDDYSEIKKLEWDEKESTRLFVHSDKPFIAEHKLSEDVTNKVVETEEKIIGFSKETVVTEKMILNLINGTKLNIVECIRCEISPINGMVALSCKDNTVKIMKVPKLPQKIVHIKLENKIFTANKILKITPYVSKQKYSLKKNDKFYDELLELKQKNKSKKEMADFLLENSSYNFNSDQNGIEVDVKDERIVRLLKGDFSALSEFDEPVLTSQLYALITKDVSITQIVDSFVKLILFCKIMENFTNIKRISNSRLLSSFLLYNNFSDFSSLEKDREAKILRGILTGDSSSCMNNRIVIGGNFYENIFQIQQILTNLENPIESEYLTEYFWLKVSCGKYEEVKNLKVLNHEIQCYNEEKSADSLKKNSVFGGIKKSAIETPRNVSSVQQRVQNMNFQQRQPVFGNDQIINKNQFRDHKQPSIMNRQPSPINTQQFNQQLEMVHSNNNLQINRGIQNNQGISQRPSMNVPKSPMIPTMGMQRNISGTRQVNLPFKSPSLPTRGINQPMMRRETNSTGFTQNTTLLAEFDQLINAVKEKAKMKQSILLNQKKERLFAVLAFYSKTQIDSALEKEIEKLVERMKTPNSTLKSDLDQLRLPNINWLQALIELIKIGY
ncbi:sec31 [Nucleospora cyclopteri]